VHCWPHSPLLLAVFSEPWQSAEAQKAPMRGDPQPQMTVKRKAPVMRR